MYALQVVYGDQIISESIRKRSSKSARKLASKHSVTFCSVHRRATKDYVAQSVSLRKAWTRESPFLNCLIGSYTLGFLWIADNHGTCASRRVGVSATCLLNRSYDLFFRVCKLLIFLYRRQTNCRFPCGSSDKIYSAPSPKNEAPCTLLRHNAPKTRSQQLCFPNVPETFFAP